MKKYISLILSLIILLSSCSDGKKELKSTIYPSELLTSEQIAPYIGYTPVMSEERSRRVSTALFVSDPIGQGDIVEVKLFQKNQLQSAQKVKENFDKIRNMRSDAFIIDSLGVESFIAYPSIHYYIDGYHIQITAGSGSDNLQKALLMNLAKLSLEKFTELTGISAETFSDSQTDTASSDNSEKSE